MRRNYHHRERGFAREKLKSCGTFHVNKQLFTRFCVRDESFPRDMIEGRRKHQQSFDWQKPPPKGKKHQQPKRVYLFFLLSHHPHKYKEKHPQINHSTAEHRRKFTDFRFIFSRLHRARRRKFHARSVKTKIHESLCVAPLFRVGEWNRCGSGWRHELRGRLRVLDASF